MVKEMNRHKKELRFIRNMACSSLKEARKAKSLGEDPAPYLIRYEAYKGAERLAQAPIEDLKFQLELEKANVESLRKAKLILSEEIKKIVRVQRYD